jgi:hypothetical protein
MVIPAAIKLRQSIILFFGASGRYGAGGAIVGTAQSILPRKKYNK